MPWSGGPFGYLDIIGAKDAVAKGEALAAKHGKQFEPPKLLRSFAYDGDKFYFKFSFITSSYFSTSSFFSVNFP